MKINFPNPFTGVLPNCWSAAVPGRRDQPIAIGFLGQRTSSGVGQVDRSENTCGGRDDFQRPVAGFVGCNSQTTAEAWNWHTVAILLSLALFASVLGSGCKSANPGISDRMASIIVT